jgi:hypothetical protein
MSAKENYNIVSEEEDEDFGTAAPPDEPPPQPISTVNPMFINKNNKNTKDFMDEVNKIQSKYKKMKPKKTEEPDLSNLSKNVITITTSPKKKSIPSSIPKPTTTPVSTMETPKPTILINEDMIESFTVMNDIGNFATSKRVIKIIFLGLLFYVLANKRTLAFTNTLSITSRVDSLIIHSCLYAIISYVILVI